MKLFLLMTGLMISLTLSSSSFAVPAMKRVVWFWIENTSDQSFASQKYIKTLWNKYPSARLTHYTALKGSTQANAFALITGSEQGITDNEPIRIAAPSIIDLFESHGVTWKVYAQDYPGACYFGPGSGDYQRYRVPFISLNKIQSNRYLCAKVVSFGILKEDTKLNALPRVSIVIANQTQGISTATSSLAVANMLQTYLDPLVSNIDMMTDTTFIISNINGSGSLFTMVLGSAVQAKALVDAPYGHYQLLKTLEVGLGLGSLVQQDQKADAISGIWK